jgi:transposase
MEVWEHGIDVNEIVLGPASHSARAQTARVVTTHTSWTREGSVPQGPPELRGVSENLHRDRQAVHAGFTVHWSSGPVEGNINRLKLVKGQVFGRAKFDLLRKRVLLAS